MLVLTRKQTEMIQIGENIFIKVIRTGRSTVKIGIEAPTNVRVIRGELAALPRVPASALAPRISSIDQPAELATVCSDQFPHPHLV
jgi:carbon storage regulator